MSKSKRSSTGRIRNKRVRSRRSINKPIISRFTTLLVEFIIKCVIIALTILIFMRIAYNLLPEVIDFDYILVNKDDLKQEVHDLVQKELVQQENTEPNKVSSIQADQSTYNLEETIEVASTTPITSRGSSLGRDNIKEKQPSFTTKATYYHPGDAFASTNRTRFTV